MSERELHPTKKCFANDEWKEVSVSMLTVNRKVNKRVVPCHYEAGILKFCWTERLGVTCTEYPLNVLRMSFNFHIDFIPLRRSQRPGLFNLMEYVAQTREDRMRIEL
jgi:hypothetical protein